MCFVRLLLLTAGMLARAEHRDTREPGSDHARATGLARLPRRWPALYSNPARGTCPTPPANPRPEPCGMRSGVSEHNGQPPSADPPPHYPRPAMKIPARQLAIGDTLCINDWQLHVIAVECEIGTAVLTAEFDFLLHFTRDDTVDVVTSSDAPPAAA